MIDKKTGTGDDIRHTVFDFGIPTTHLGSQHDSVQFRLRRATQGLAGEEYNEPFYLVLDRVYPKQCNRIADIYWGGPYLNMKNSSHSNRVIVTKRTLSPTEELAVCKCIREYVMPKRDDYDHFAIDANNFEEYYMKDAK